MHQAFVQYLRSLSQFGLRDVPAPTTTIVDSLNQSVQATQAKIESGDNLLDQVKEERPSIDPSPTGTAFDPKKPIVETAAPTVDAGDTKSNLERLQILSDQVKNCFECPELVSNRTQTVFGVGNPEPRLCFMGEAPGADEDVQGEPFVGAAGKLLTRIIEACKMSRDDVYILNTIKCRPPNNRNPADQECANCRSFLDEQLSILKPEFICCLGGIAAKHLLDTPSPVGRLRGKLHRYGDIDVVVTYHPAYLLRNPDAKRHVWNDMKFLMKSMGQPID